MFGSIRPFVSLCVGTHSHGIQPKLSRGMFVVSLAQRLITFNYIMFHVGLRDWRQKEQILNHYKI